MPLTFALKPGMDAILPDASGKVPMPKASMVTLAADAAAVSSAQQAYVTASDNARYFPAQFTTAETALKNAFIKWLYDLTDAPIPTGQTLADYSETLEYIKFVRPDLFRYPIPNKIGFGVTQTSVDNSMRTY